MPNSGFGIRALEAARLRLDDIDWRSGCVVIRASKNHRERSLPLPEDVGQALLDYLRHGRPPTTCRDIFLEHAAPFQPLQTASAITKVVKRLLAQVILSFLDHLEQQRHNSIRSRNARLPAIHTFFRWIALRDPESISLATRVLAIPLKRADKKLVQALSREEIEAILAATDLTNWQGRRDHALLLTLYNSGARVSEITSLERGYVHFGVSTVLRLHGKGRKERAAPLWTKTSRALQAWFRELERAGHQIAFPSARGRPLSRDGVDYILQQAVTRAAERCESLRHRKVSPHTLRHTTAMHLLQAGVDISVIALWLGHESIETTHIYLEVDLETKERAINKLSPAGSEMLRFKANDDVLAFLAAL